MWRLGRAGIALCFLMTMVVLYSTAPQVTIGVVPDGVSQLVRKFYPSGDSVVYEGDPDRNFGSHWEIGVNYRNGSRDRSFIIFDLSEMPPGSIISSATLNLYMYDAPNLSRMLACYEIIEKWDEFKITWNMQPTAPVFVTSISTGNKSKLLSLDVKGSVIKFTSKDVVNYEPNYGWMLKDLAEGSGSVDVPFWMCSREHDPSKRPYLEVKYYPPHLELELSSSSVEAGNWVKIRVYRKTNDGDPITCGVLRIKLSSNSTSAISKFSLTKGGPAITELKISSGSSYADFYYYDERAGAWKITVTTEDYPNYVGSNKILKIIPGPLDHFAFDAISSPKQVLVPFLITITARDIYKNIKIDYAGTNSLSDTTGTIAPMATGSFVNGKWTGNVVIKKIDKGIKITTSGGGKVGESNSFDVLAGPPAKLVITPSNFTMAAGIVYSYLTLFLKDTNDFESTSVSDIFVSLSTTSPTGEFKQLGTMNVITNISIPAGESSIKVDYQDATIGVQTLTAQAIGLITGTASVIVKLDKNPPNTTMLVGNPNYRSNATFYVSGQTAFLISASDDISGIREIRYKIDEGPWNLYNETFVLSAYSNGPHTLRYYSVDRANNREDEKKFEIILDKVPPHIEDAFPIENLIVGSKSVVFTIKVSDTGSGTKEVRLIVDGILHGAMVRDETKYTKTLSLNEGDHTWSVKVLDNVNNSAVYGYSFKLILDTTRPTISQFSIPSNPVFGESTKINCSVSDDISGVKDVYLCYSIDSGSSWTRVEMVPQDGIYSGSIPSQMFFTEVQCYIEAIDNAGNTFKTPVSKYTVGIPIWLYLIIIALIAIVAIRFFLRRLPRKGKPLFEQTRPSSLPSS